MRTKRTPSGLLKLVTKRSGLLKVATTRRKHKLKLNGKEVTPAEFHRDGPIGGSGIPMAANTYQDHAPLISEGIGCLKAQVPEMRETIRKHNIQGVRVRDTGQLEITSRQGRKELLRVRGLADADGGFGD